MQALRLYMALGQRDKVVTVLVDTARTCLAVKDAARASTLLLKANTLVDQVRLRFESQRLGVPKTFCAWSCKPTASGCPHNDTHHWGGGGGMYASPLSHSATPFSAPWSSAPSPHRSIS